MKCIGIRIAKKLNGDNGLAADKDDEVAKIVKIGFVASCFNHDARNYILKFKLSNS